MKSQQESRAYLAHLKMYTLGHSFIPAVIHAGDLRYYDEAPLLSKPTKEQYIEAVAYQQQEVFEAAKLFTQLEGFPPAPEPAHAIKSEKISNRLRPHV